MDLSLRSPFSARRGESAAAADTAGAFNATFFRFILFEHRILSLPVSLSAFLHVAVHCLDRIMRAAQHVNAVHSITALILFRDPFVASLLVRLCSALAPALSCYSHSAGATGAREFTRQSFSAHTRATRSGKGETI